ncbi:MAG TPA: SCO family protein [Gammaproteobacteria bacterium]|nr:SCO family protein [Gammaproteobacteria bacterium]
MLRVLVVALVVLVAAIVWRPSADRVRPPSVATILPERVQLPDVPFVDQKGAPFHLASLRGNYTWLFFGFTNCPDICPLTLKTLADARAALAARAPLTTPKVVFVSVDQARDTPERIAEYLSHFDPEFVGVTATEADLAPLLKKLGVTVEKHDHGGGAYTVVHNSTLYVLGPAGEWIALSRGPQDAAALEADYPLIRLRYRSIPASAPPTPPG